jgi:hypothetical protein
MAKQSIPLLDLSVKAAGAITERRCVGFDSLQATVQGQKVMGVAKQGAASGAYLAVGVIGTVIVEAGAAVAVGDALIADANGKAIPTTGALAIKAGATAVTSTAANGAGILQGSTLPEYVFADALEAASGAGAFIEVLLRR